MDAQSGAAIACGFESAGNMIDSELIDEACEIARDADAAVIFAGLPECCETEGADRTHLGIPEGHRVLIEKVAVEQKNVVVVLSNGAPVEMPWLDSAGAVLEGYLGGQGFGGAVAALLFGDANPCGRLAETFPEKLADTPAYLNFPGERDKVEYREGLFVGYRYWDAKDFNPLFPFGYGLSYTDFAYSGMRVDKKELNDTDRLTVTVTVKNIGKVYGKETVQLYVRPEKTGVIRPVKELKGFLKLPLDPGEEKDAVFTLDRRAFSYYDPNTGEWRVRSGKYEILAGKSSRDIVLHQSVYIASTYDAVHELFTENSTVSDILEYPDRAERVDDYFARLNFMGCGRLADLPVLFRDMPLRSLLVFVPEGFRYSTLDEMLNLLNGNTE